MELDRIYKEGWEKCPNPDVQSLIQSYTAIAAKRDSTFCNQKIWGFQFSLVYIKVVGLWEPVPAVTGREAG